MKPINFYRIVSSLIVILTSTTQVKAGSDCYLLDNVTGYTAVSQSKTLMPINWIAFANGKILQSGQSRPDKDFQQCVNFDGKGQFLLPGLIDAHGHIAGLGNEMLRVKLRDVPSQAEAVMRVKAFAMANPEAQWILGRGWNQVLWPDQKFPTKASLDLTNIDKPIVLRRIDGHAAWVNSKALQIANINKNTPDPAGGKIERDSQGNATGLLIDNAMALVENRQPKASIIEQNHALDKAFKHLLSLGIVSVHDAGIDQANLRLYQQRLKADNLPLRIYAMLDGASDALTGWLKNGVIEDDHQFLSVRSVKLYADGALGSRGAALLAPYSDDADNEGLLVTQPHDLNALIKMILKRGFQTNVHAIGDRGNQLVLDAFEKAYKKVGGQQLRNRIEHAQVVSLPDIARFKPLNIIASMQPIHATSDMNMAGDRIGAERLKGAYAWQKMLQQGTIIAAGSDFPIELANVFHGIHAAVTRQDRNNQPTGGWLADEKMTPAQALRSFTLDAAFAAHQEQQLGSLEPGKWADFILVDRDIINGDPQAIWQTQVLQTWIAGELKYIRE